MASIRLLAGHDVLFVGLKVGENYTGTAGNAEKRIIGNAGRHAGDLGDEGIDVFEQRAAAGNNYAFVHNIRAEFGRCHLKYAFDDLNDLAQVVRDGFGDFIGGNLDCLRIAASEIAALDADFLLIRLFHGRTDIDLNQFSSALADRQAMLFFDVIDDRLIELVAADADGLSAHDTA